MMSKKRTFSKKCKDDLRQTSRIRKYKASRSKEMPGKYQYRFKMICSPECVRGGFLPSAVRRYQLTLAFTTLFTSNSTTTRTTPGVFTNFWKINYRYL